MKKRIFSWFLTLVMVLGMLPMTALAEELTADSYSVGTEEQGIVSLLAEDTEVGEESQNNQPPAEPMQQENPPVETAKVAKINALLHNIAASYVDNSGEWKVIGMAAYEDLFPDSQYKTSDKARQEYIDSTIASITKDGAGDTTYGKAIIGLTALGIDVEKLYTVNSNEPISAIKGLNGVSHSPSVWCMPYTMAAYNQNDYSGTEQYEASLIEAVLHNQADDGSWNEWGSVQSTANAIIGLSLL